MSALLLLSVISYLVAIGSSDPTRKQTAAISGAVFLTGAFLA